MEWNLIHTKSLKEDEKQMFTMTKGYREYIIFIIMICSNKLRHEEVEWIAYLPLPRIFCVSRETSSSWLLSSAIGFPSGSEGICPVAFEAFQRYVGQGKLAALPEPALRISKARH